MMKSIAGLGVDGPLPGNGRAQARKAPILPHSEDPIAILCQSMPDELAIGHLGRIMWLNEVFRGVLQAKCWTEVSEWGSALGRPRFNRCSAKPQVPTTAYSKQEWLPFSLAQTPVFYFVDDGRIVGELVGWPADRKASAFLDAARDAGFVP